MQKSVALNDLFFITTWVACVLSELIYFSRDPRFNLSFFIYVSIPSLVGMILAITTAELRCRKTDICILVMICALIALYSYGKVPSDRDSHFFRTSIAPAMFLFTASFFFSLATEFVSKKMVLFAKRRTKNCIEVLGRPR